MTATMRKRLLKQGLSDRIKRDGWVGIVDNDMNRGFHFISHPKVCKVEIIQGMNCSDLLRFSR